MLSLTVFFVQKIQSLLRKEIKNMLEILQTINGYLADYILSFLLLGTGIYFTLKTRFVQIRCFGEGMKSPVAS